MSVKRLNLLPFLYVLHPFLHVSKLKSIEVQTCRLNRWRFCREVAFEPVPFVFLCPGSNKKRGPTWACLDTSEHKLFYRRAQHWAHPRWWLKTRRVCKATWLSKACCIATAMLFAWSALLDLDFYRLRSLGEKKIYIYIYITHTYIYIYEYIYCDCLRVNDLFTCGSRRFTHCDL